MPSTGLLVEVVENRPIKVIASRNVSYIITQAGNVYAFGENNNSVPTLLETELDIIDISEDYMLDMNGDIYNLENQERITIVEKIKYITEGATHTVFLSENNTAYAIGSNTYGQFGDGTYVSNETEVVAIRNKDLTDILRNIEKIEAGDIISYLGEKSSYAGKVITHKVIESPTFSEDDGVYYLTTAGIREGAHADPEIKHTQVLGKLVCVVPLLGWVYNLFTTWYGFLFFILIVLFAFSSEIINIIKILKYHDYGEDVSQEETNDDSESNDSEGTENAELEKHDKP